MFCLLVCWGRIRSILLFTEKFTFTNLCVTKTESRFRNILPILFLPSNRSYSLNSEMEL